MKKFVEEHEKVPLLLSRKQINLITDHTMAEDDLVDALQTAEVSSGRRRVFFTLDDLEHLSGHVAAAANHCDDRKLQRELDALYEHINNVERKYDVRY